MKKYFLWMWNRREVIESALWFGFGLSLILSDNAIVSPIFFLLGLCNINLFQYRRELERRNRMILKLEDALEASLKGELERLDLELDELKQILEM